MIKDFRSFSIGGLVGITIGAIAAFVGGYDTAEKQLRKEYQSVLEQHARMIGQARQEAINRGFAELVIIPDHVGGGIAEFRWREGEKPQEKPVQATPKKPEVPASEKMIDMPNRRWDDKRRSENS